MSDPSSRVPLGGPTDDTGTDIKLESSMPGRDPISYEKTHAVFELMQTENVSFREAAKRMGFVPQENLAKDQPSPKIAPESDGLIETVIHRIATNRQLVLRRGEPVEPGPQLVLARDPDDRRSEKIRALRTELLLLSEASSRANTLAMLSACAGEGRSLLAAELAISFSQLGRPTLLVDADLRKPRLHELFGSTNLSGLSDALSLNQAPLIHPVRGLAQLWFLKSGLIPPNPLELLSAGRFGKLLQDWRKSYDFVVLDTPPVRDYADGLAIATLAGRVLLLSRSQHTSFKETTDMLRRLATTQSRILGAVINHF